MRAVKLSVKKLVSVFAVLSLMVILPVVGIGVNKAQAATISCDGSTVTINADGGTIPVDDLGVLTCLLSGPTSLVVIGTANDISNTLANSIDFVSACRTSGVQTPFSNIMAELTENSVITNSFVDAFTAVKTEVGVSSQTVTIDADGHTVTLADGVDNLGSIRAINNVSNINQLGEQLSDHGLGDAVIVTGNSDGETGGSSDGETSDGDGSSSAGSSGSYSGPTQFTDEIEGQLATAREFTVLNSDLANFQIDVKDLNLVPGEPIEAFVFSTPTYAGVVTPVDGIATFNLANLNLSAGTHTLAVVQPGTNVVKGKATVKVGNSAEAKIAKTAGNSAATGLIAFALILTAAFTTAATRRKNNA